MDTNAKKLIRLIEEEASEWRLGCPPVDGGFFISDKYGLCISLDILDDYNWEKDAPVERFWFNCLSALTYGFDDVDIANIRDAIQSWIDKGGYLEIND